MQSTKRPFDEDQPSCDQSTKHPRIDSDQASSIQDAYDQNNSNRAVKIDSSKSTQTPVSDKTDIPSLNNRTIASQASENLSNGTIKSNDMKASNLLKNIVIESLQTDKNSGKSTGSSEYKIQVPQNHDYVQLRVPQNVVLKQGNNGQTVVKDEDIPNKQTDKGTYNNDSTERNCKVVKVERAHSSEENDGNTHQKTTTPPVEQQTNKQFQKISQHRFNVQQNVVQLGNGVNLTNISIPARALSAPFTIPVSVATHLPGTNIVYLRPAADGNNVSNVQQGVLTPLKGGTNTTSNYEIGSKKNLKVEKTLGLPGTSQGSPLGTCGETIRSVYYLSANVKNMSVTNSQKNENPSPNTMPGTNISYKSRGTNYRNRNGNIKRPMNAFMLWARNYRRNISQSMPLATNAEISVRLGQVWANLPSEEKEQYYKEAEKIKLQHRINFPGWVYKPNQTKKDVDTQHVRLWQKYGTKRPKTKVAQQSKVNSKSSSSQTDISITYPESSSTSTSSKDSASKSQENIQPAIEAVKALPSESPGSPSNNSDELKCAVPLNASHESNEHTSDVTTPSTKQKLSSVSSMLRKQTDTGEQPVTKSTQTVASDNGNSRPTKKNVETGENKFDTMKHQTKSTRHPVTDKTSTSTVKRGRPPSVTKRIEDPLLKEQYKQKKQQSKGKKDADKQTKERSGNKKKKSKSGSEEKQLDKISDNTTEKRQLDKECDKTEEKRQLDKARDKTKENRQLDKGCDKAKEKRQLDKGCDKTKEKRQLDKGRDKTEEKRQLDKGCVKTKSKTSHLKGSDFHRKQTPTKTSTNKKHFQSSDVKSLDKAYKTTTEEGAPTSASAEDTNSELWPFPFPTIDHDVHAEVLVDDELRDERGIDRDYIDPYRPFYYNSNEDNDRKATTYQVDVSSWQKYLNDSRFKMDNNKTKSNYFTPIIKSEKDDDVENSQSDLDICPTPVAVTLRRRNNYTFCSSVSAPETSTSKLHITSEESQLSGRPKTNDNKLFRSFNRADENINYNAYVQQKETTSEFASSLTSAINVLEDNDVEYSNSTSYRINNKKESNKNSSTTAGYVRKSEDSRPLKKRTDRFMRDFPTEVKGYAKPNISSIKTNDGTSVSSVSTLLTRDRYNGVGDSNTSSTVTSTNLNQCNTSAASSSFQGDIIDVNQDQRMHGAKNTNEDKSQTDFVKDAFGKVSDIVSMTTQAVDAMSTTTLNTAKIPM